MLLLFCALSTNENEVKDMIPIHFLNTMYPFSYNHHCFMAFPMTEDTNLSL